MSHINSDFTFDSYPIEKDLTESNNENYTTLFKSTT